MFGFGSFSHLLVVLVLALILLGPKQLPEVARTLGRLLTELRRASNLLTDEFRQQMREDEHQKIIRPEGSPVVHHSTPSAPQTPTTHQAASSGESDNHPTSEEKKS